MLHLSGTPHPRSLPPRRPLPPWHPDPAPLPTAPPCVAHHDLDVLSAVQTHQVILWDRSYQTVSIVFPHASCMPPQSCSPNYQLKAHKFGCEPFIFFLYQKFCIFVLMRKD